MAEVFIMNLIIEALSKKIPGNWQESEEKVGVPNREVMVLRSYGCRGEILGKLQLGLIHNPDNWCYVILYEGRTVKVIDYQSKDLLHPGFLIFLDQAAQSTKEEVNKIIASILLEITGVEWQSENSSPMDWEIPSKASLYEIEGRWHCYLDSNESESSLPFCAVDSLAFKQWLKGDLWGMAA